MNEKDLLKAIEREKKKKEKLEKENKLLKNKLKEIKENE